MPHLLSHYLHTSFSSSPLPLSLLPFISSLSILLSSLYPPFSFSILLLYPPFSFSILLSPSLSSFLLLCPPFYFLLSEHSLVRFPALLLLPLFRIPLHLTFLILLTPSISYFCPFVPPVTLLHLLFPPSPPSPRSFC